ncbi:MAG TPA: hypothetical protein VGG62_05130, partial [Terracidiphilus sp.]
MRAAWGTWCLAAVLAGGAASQGGGSNGGWPMQNDVGSTARSPDPRELLASALALARSNRAEDHQQLLNMLWSADFLSRLDSPAEYAQTGRRLRISMVLDAL